MEAKCPDRTRKTDVCTSINQKNDFSSYLEPFYLCLQVCSPRIYKDALSSLLLETSGKLFPELKMFSALRLFVAASWLGLAFAVTASPLGKRQGVNEVYPGNEAQQTAALNTTYYFVPIAAEEARSLAGGRALLKPKGLPEGYLKDDEHVLFVQDGYTTDIRMLDLRVDHIRNLLIQGWSF